MGENPVFNPAFNPYAAPIFPQQPKPEVYTIGHGPEYDRWNEALIQRGQIRIPKELDGPQEWLNMPHIQKYIEHNGIGREDLPDGSVILSLAAPTS